MLKSFDRLLAPATWLVAGVLVVMLLAGPRIVAHDDAAERSAGAAAGAGPGYAGASGGGGGAGAAAEAGRGVFVDTCGSCHTLSAAGTSGVVGPALDGTSLDATAVEALMRSGRGAMPSFEGSLDDADIAAVAAFVAGAAGG